MSIVINEPQALFKVGDKVKWIAGYDQSVTGLVLDSHIPDACSEHGLDIFYEYLVEWNGGTGW